MPLRSARLGLIFGLIFTLAPLSAATVSKQQADVFVRKLGEIRKPNPPAIKPGMRRTPVTEGELNSWFAYEAAPLLPKGVSQPQLTLVGDGKVTGQVTVDLGTAGKARGSGGMLDPWSYLGGRVPVNVVGILHTKDGVGRFELQSADVSGLPVPKLLLQEMLSLYSRTPKTPDGISLDDQFELPANIRQIEVGQGRAVVVQ